MKGLAFRTIMESVAQGGVVSRHTQEVAKHLLALNDAEQQAAIAKSRLHALLQPPRAEAA